MSGTISTPTRVYEIPGTKFSYAVVPGNILVQQGHLDAALEVYQLGTPPSPPMGPCNLPLSSHALLVLTCPTTLLSSYAQSVLTRTIPLLSSYAPSVLTSPMPLPGLARYPWYCPRPHYPPPSTHLVSLSIPTAHSFLYRPVLFFFVLPSTNFASTFVPGMRRCTRGSRLRAFAAESSPKASLPVCCHLWSQCCHLW